jgi:hypothetical protein
MWTNKCEQGLLTPYMSFVIQALVDHLRQFQSGGGSDESRSSDLDQGQQSRLWLAIVDVLSPSFAFDDGGELTLHSRKLF